MLGTTHTKWDYCTSSGAWWVQVIILQEINLNGANMIDCPPHALVKHKTKVQSMICMDYLLKYPIVVVNKELSKLWVVVLPDGLWIRYFRVPRYGYHILTLPILQKWVVAFCLKYNKHWLSQIALPWRSELKQSILWYGYGPIPHWLCSKAMAPFPSTIPQNSQSMLCQLPVVSSDHNSRTMPLWTNPASTMEFVTHWQALHSLSLGISTPKHYG
jgi:hypothetical protein